jgi:hypothetical protein
VTVEADLREMLTEAFLSKLALGVCPLVDLILPALAGRGRSAEVDQGGQ